MAQIDVPQGNDGGAFEKGSGEGPDAQDEEAGGLVSVSTLEK